MIQEINPSKFYNEYQESKPESNSLILCFDGDKCFMKEEEDKITYPTFLDIQKIKIAVDYIYLFRIDNELFFLGIPEEALSASGFSYIDKGVFRKDNPKHLAFAGMAGYHLSIWYESNKFCGKCGYKTKKDHRERMLYCSHCKNTIYPKIAPAIIVGIRSGEKLLLTKYAGRDFKKYALIAGFVEVGETPEEAVIRETMEETGLKVKDIKYYKSQPWGFSQSLLLGYFATLDGSDKIVLDEEELSLAEWISRDEIPVKQDGFSLTNEMIMKFKNREDEE